MATLISSFCPAVSLAGLPGGFLERSESNPSSSTDFIQEIRVLAVSPQEGLRDEALAPLSIRLTIVTLRRNFASSDMETMRFPSSIKDCLSDLKVRKFIIHLRTYCTTVGCIYKAELLMTFTIVNYKVALQPNKQLVIWKTLCNTFAEKFDGDIRYFFHQMEFEVFAIKEYIQKNKKLFPYLGGNKICNYWLYVMEQYTDAEFKDRGNITVAPDTHVIQASMKLGVITEEETRKSDVQIILADRWCELLKGTEYVPIDLHTPMWLWSRGKFSVKVIESNEK